MTSSFAGRVHGAGDDVLPCFVLLPVSVCWFQAGGLYLRLVLLVQTHHQAGPPAVVVVAEAAHLAETGVGSCHP